MRRETKEEMSKIENVAEWVVIAIVLWVGMLVILGGARMLHRHSGSCGGDGGCRWFWCEHYESGRTTPPAAQPNRGMAACGTTDFSGRATPPEHNRGRNAR